MHCFGNRAANETSSTLKCAYDEVAGDMVLQGAVLECLSVVCSLDDPSTSYQGSCMVTCQEGYEAGGIILTTFLLWSLVSETQTVDLSSSQTLCSDTLVQSGVGVNSSCKVVFIGDTCMVFCSEG